VIIVMWLQVLKKDRGKPFRPHSGCFCQIHSTGLPSEGEQFPDAAQVSRTTHPAMRRAGFLRQQPRVNKENTSLILCEEYNGAKTSETHFTSSPVGFEERSDY